MSAITDLLRTSTLTVPGQVPPVQEADLLDFHDYPRMRNYLYDQVKTAVINHAKVENDRYSMSFSDVDYSGPESYSLDQQREAILKDLSLSRRLMGKVVVTDKATGKPVASARRVLMNVPCLTDRGTFIHNGVEYVGLKQFRLAPNVYTRTTDDGMVESQFNVAPRTGQMFRIFMDPSSSEFFMRYGGRKVPLYPALRRMGVSDAEMQLAWGKDIWKANAKDRIPPHAAHWLKEMEEQGSTMLQKQAADAPDPEASAKAIRAVFERMRLDPEVVKSTLGEPYGNVTPAVMLKATGKILRVYRGEDSADDRDSLAYQSVHDTGDFLAEKIKQDQNNILKTALWRVTGRQGDVERFPSGLFDKHTQYLMQNTGLVQCYDKETQVLTRRGFVPWPDVSEADEFACCVDGHLVYHKARRLIREWYRGPMYSCRTDSISYLVTPNHRCVFRGSDHRADPGADKPDTYRVLSADQVHGRQAWFCATLPPYDGLKDGEFVLAYGKDRWETPAEFRVPIRAWARFLGWFVSEGYAIHHGNYWRITIAQDRNAHPKEAADIEDTLRRVGLPVLYNQKGRAYQINHKGLCQYLLTLGKSREKRIPRYLFGYDREILQEFFDAYVLGDGCVDRGHIKMCTASPGLAADLVELIGRLGQTGHWSVRTFDNPNWAASNVVSVRKSQQACVGSSGASKTRGLTPWSVVEYEDMVYCAEVPGGLLYVLRNGKAHWSGNSIDEINPIDMYNQNARVVRLGEGAISSIDAAPKEARNVQPSYLGFVDPIRSPESLRIGLDMFLARNVRKGPNNMLYTRMVNAKTGKEDWISSRQAAFGTVAFPGALESRNRFVPAIVNAKEVAFVNRKDVDYVLPTGDDMFSTGADTVPLKSGVKGMRLLMGCLAPSTKVLIRKTLTYWYGTIEDYLWEEGDECRTVDSSGKAFWTPVLGVRKNTTAIPALRVELKSGRSLHTTDNHMWVTMGEDGTLRQIRADRLQKGMPIPREGRIVCDTLCSELVIPGRDRWKTYPEKRLPLNFDWGWVLGLYLAEGSIGFVERASGEGVPASVSFAAEQPDIRSKLTALFSAAGIHAGEQKHVIQVSWSSFAEMLEGMFSHGSFQKRLSGFVFGTPEEFRLGLLSGYLDGDGGFALRRENVRVKGGSRSEALVDDLMMLASSLGIDTVKSVTEVVGVPFYLFEVRTQDLTKLAPPVHPDKRARLQTAPGWSGKKSYHWVPIYAALREKILAVSKRKEQFRQRLYVDQCTQAHLQERLSSKDCPWIFSSVIWDRVENIEEVDELQISYDLDLGDRPLACGCGVFVHNSKFVSHALPLENREAPLVQTQMSDGRSLGRTLAPFMGASFARKDGMVTRVGKNKVTVQYADGEMDDVEVYRNFPLARKTHLHGEPCVKTGDAFKAGDPLVLSNFTDKTGQMALGRNMRVGYMPYYGKNYEDAIVISEGAAKKLASPMTYHTDFDPEEDTVASRKRFTALFPGKYSREQLETIDDSGMVRPGTVVNKGDPLIVAVREQPPSKSTMGRPLLTNASEVWEHESPGLVTDVVAGRRGHTIYVQSVTPMKVADKLALPWGSKGVVSEIVPDEEMPRDEQGRALDMLLSPLSIASRTNGAQLVAAALGKVAEKTGRPYVLPGFSNTNMVEFAQRELDRTGTKVREEIYDPRSRKTVPKVFVGNTYVYRLQQLAESKGKARSTGGYTMDEVPSRGGPEGSKHIGCFPAHQTVLTLHGERRISHLVEKRLSELVWTLDRATGQWGYRPIVDWFRYRASPEDLLRVEVEDAISRAGGRCGVKHTSCLYPTKQHRVFLFDGREVRADELKAGDDLVTWGPVPNQNQIQLAAGSLLGDMYLSGTHLQCMHSLKQKNYLNFKQRILSGLGAVGSEIESEGRAPDGKRHRRALLSIPSSALRRQMQALCFDENGKKRVTPEWLDTLGGLGLAVFVLDDGNITNHAKKAGQVSLQGSLAVNSFSFGEAHTIANWLGKTLGLSETPRVFPVQNGECPNIYLSAEACARLVTLLARYIPADAIPKSKHVVCRLVRELQRSVQPPERLSFSCSLGPVPATVRSVSPYEDPKGGGEFWVYDFTVDETHTYTAGNVLVSNSMELQALLSHHVPTVLADLKLIKGQKNDAFWRQLKLGQTPSMPDTPLVYKKFKALLRATGINLQETPAGDSIFAMTDGQVRELTGNRRITVPETLTVDFKPIPGGLFDPDVTGGSGKGDRFSYIELPEPMLNPVMEAPVRSLLGMTQAQLGDVISGKTPVEGKVGGEALKTLLKKLDLEEVSRSALETIKSGAVSKRDAAMSRYGYAQALRKQGLRPEDFLWTRVPVLPPAFRPILRQRGMTVVTDPNKGYRSVMHSLEDLRDASKLPDQDLHVQARGTAYQSLKALVGLADPVNERYRQQNVGGLLQQLFGKGSPKGSFVQRRVIGANMDLSGLAVITPNPDLKLNEVGLPENRAWDLYEPFVIRELVMQGVPATQAAHAVEKRTPLAYEALQGVVKQRPVLINRAPTMHKYSIMAAWPRLVKGDTLQIPPAITAPFTADFDGDLCLGKVFFVVSLDNPVWRVIVSRNPEWFEQRRIEMQGRTKALLQDADGAYLFDLSEVPHEEKVEFVSQSTGASFHRVAEGLRVIVYDEASGEPSLKPVLYWSEHLPHAIEIVTLQSGRQLVTDDDPRAVYGFSPETWEFVRRRPSEAVGVLVPRVERAETLDNKAFFLETMLPEDLPEKMGALSRDFGYLCGATVGDGWISQDATLKTPIKGVCLAGVEESVALRWKRGAEEVYGQELPWNVVHQTKEKDENRWGNCTRWTLNRSALGKYLLPLIGAGANKKHLPPFYATAPREFRLGLLEGLLDTDGTINSVKAKAKKKPQLQAAFCTGSIRLAQEVQHLARLLGVRSRITASQSSPTGTGAWYVAFSFAELQALQLRLENSHKREVYQTPVEASVSHGAASEYVPISRDLAAKIRKLFSPEKQKNLYMQMFRAGQDLRINRQAAEEILKKLPADFVHEHLRRFRMFAQNTDVVWDRVESIEKTGVLEEGYDLTVPGYETFMNVDGVILSNTMSYTVPVSKKAVEEAISRMLPEQNLRSARNDAVHYKPSQEFLQGLYFASKDPVRRPVQTFRSLAEAKKAYQEGRIRIDDPIRLEGQR